MIKKYVKKPVTIEAIQWTGDNTHEICVFVGDEIQRQRESIIIPTLEGDMTASLGDYIIKGVRGEFYPCKPDIFRETYVEAESEDDDAGEGSI